MGFRAISHTSQPKPKKKKKKKIPPPPQKKNLIFQEMELSSSNIKIILMLTEMKPYTFQHPTSKHFTKENLLYFLEKIHCVFSKEIFLYFSRNGTHIFQSKLKKSKKILQENISYTSGNGNPHKFLIFWETENLKKLLILQEVTCKA